MSNDLGLAFISIVPISYCAISYMDKLFCMDLYDAFTYYILRMSHIVALTGHTFSVGHKRSIFALPDVLSPYDASVRRRYTGRLVCIFNVLFNI